MEVIDILDAAAAAEESIQLGARLEIATERSSDGLGVVAVAWAAAASVANALAPKWVALALIQSEGRSDVERLAALLDASGRAYREGVGIEPRGFDVCLRSGRLDKVIWESDTHFTQMTFEADAYMLTIEQYDAVVPRTTPSRRHLAALAILRIGRECGWEFRLGGAPARRRLHPPLGKLS